MTDLVRRDPFRNLFPWPRWDDFEDLTSQKGLKIKETEKNIIVEAVVAGVPSDAVDIEIEDGVLAIKAETRVDEERKEEHVSSSYQYYYSCALSGGQWDKASAQIKDGVVFICSNFFNLQRIDHLKIIDLLLHVV